MIPDRQKATGKIDSLRVLQYAVLVILLLYISKPLLIPLSIALLIGFILYPMCIWMERHGIPRSIAIFFSLMFFLVLGIAVLGLLSHQFAEFMGEWSELKIKLNAWLRNVDANLPESWIQVFLDKEQGLIGSIVKYVLEYILPLVPKTIYQSSISLILLVLIPVYVALILFYRDVLVRFLYEAFPKSSAHYITSVLPNVIVTYFNFVKGMALVYLIVGILNSIGLAILGIPNPIFFGFIASILTFIPYVGITIGAILPMTISWLKFDSVFYPLGVVVVFTIVQILEANVIFPLAVSNKLKINALVTLVVIVGGGILWGSLGMILFLPFMGILKLIADEVESLKAISILLGTRKDLIEEAREPIL